MTAEYTKLIRRKYLIAVEVDGHTFDDAMRELQRMVDHLEQHREKCSSVGGGGASGHIVTVDVKEDQTPEKFEAQLEEFRNRRDIVAGT